MAQQNHNTRLTVEKTMGDLREINLGREPALTTINPDKFVAEKETIRVWSDYGQYNEDRIHFIVDGIKPESIKLGTVEFWPVIKDIHYFQLSCENQNHTFTINGAMHDGEIFEEEFYISGGYLIPSIIYAMCLISELGHSNAAEYWRACHKYNGHLNYTTQGEFLDKVIKFKESSEKLVEKYPFMQSFLQKCLKTLTIQLEDSLNNIAILRTKS